MLTVNLSHRLHGFSGRTASFTVSVGELLYKEYTAAVYPVERIRKATQYGDGGRVSFISDTQGQSQ